MIGLVGMIVLGSFMNSPMEEVIIRHTTKFPVFGTEGTRAEVDAMGLPRAAQDPRLPYVGFYPDSPCEWLAHHRAILRDAPSQPWRIVFIGDSITQGWLRTEEWSSIFKPLGAFNMGIGGDRTSQVLWRISHGELDHVRPKVVVLMIGTNNMWADFDKFGADGVAAGTHSVIEAIRSKLPTTQIVLLDIPPMLADPNHPVRNHIRTVNAATRTLADGKTVVRVDVGNCLLGEHGSIDSNLMSDYVHPTQIGYTRIARILKPVIEAQLARSPE